MAAKKDDGRRVVAENRQARHEYFLTDTMEAGLQLTGTEVKSLRAGKASRRLISVVRRSRRATYQAIEPSPRASAPCSAHGSAAISRISPNPIHTGHQRGAQKRPSGSSGTPQAAS